MNELPDWLPDMLCLDGDWNSTLARLYEVFERDIKNGRLLCDGMPVWYDRRVLVEDTYGYEEGFWHVVTKDEWETRSGCKEKKRLPDFRRAERLPWLAPSVRHITESEVTFWQCSGKKGRTEIYIWLHDLDYVVVFAKQDHRRGPVAFLMTAYYVEGGSSRRSLRKKYERRMP